METINFKDIDLSPEVQKAVADMGFEEATPIQSMTINPILEGRDVIGQAQTGTGKTCAFGIPAIEMLGPQDNGVQVLVLCPTRELAIQISEELTSVARYKSWIRILPIYGGQPIDRQIIALKKRPQIIIGTPGRVMDHMRRGTLKFDNLRMLVLDEADEMLNMGFREDIDLILTEMPEKKQMVLFSATMAPEIMEITRLYQKDPLILRATHRELTVSNIEQFYLEVRESSKLEVLSRLIDANNIRLSLVFCNTKKRVDDLTTHLQSRGYSAEALHGDMKQSMRDRVMNKFRAGQIEILVATDVAARGIDVDDIEAVFNYDLPNDEEYYVHRIGRTGRAGRTGKAYSLAAGRENARVKYIERYTKSQIRLIKPPTILDVEESKLSAVLQSVKQTLTENKYAKYAPYIERVADEINTDDEHNNITTLDVAAALLKLLGGQNEGKNEPIEEVFSYADRDRNRGDRGDRGPQRRASHDLEPGMVRLFVNLGRNGRLQPKHIVESFASHSQMPGKMIGAICIFDKFTFVDVPEKFADEVIAGMKGETLMGSKVHIEKTVRKKESGGGFNHRKR